MAGTCDGRRIDPTSFPVRAIQTAEGIEKWVKRWQGRFLCARACADHQTSNPFTYGDSIIPNITFKLSKHIKAHIIVKLLLEQNASTILEKYFFLVK